MCWPTRTTSRNVGKRLPAPSCVDRSRRPPTWGWADGAGRSLGDAQRHKRPLYSFLGCYLLGHRAALRSVTPNPRGPSHTPLSVKDGPTRTESVTQLISSGQATTFEERIPARIPYRGKGRPPTPESPDGAFLHMVRVHMLRVHAHMRNRPATSDPPSPAPPHPWRGQCSRGAGTTRSTSGWTVSSCRMAASAPEPSPAASASTMRAWWETAASLGRSHPVTGPPDT